MATISMATFEGKVMLNILSFFCKIQLIEIAESHFRTLRPLRAKIGILFFPSFCQMVTFSSNLEMHCDFMEIRVIGSILPSAMLLPNQKSKLVLQGLNDQFSTTRMELSSSSHDFWLGVGCFAYNTFHVGQIFSACLEVVWTFEGKTFYIGLSNSFWHGKRY